MAPRKTVAQHGDKRKRFDDSLFRSPQHFERYALQFKTAPIIQERQVYLDDLKDSFIPSCFEGQGWDKLLGEFLEICDPLIREFYANASLKEEHIECWVRGHEFTLDIENIDDLLGFEDQNHEGGSLNTASFPLDLRCLAYIMIFNLNPIKKLSTINNARAIFLMELRENTNIDISAHLYNIIVDSIKTTSRSKLVTPNFIMRILYNKGVETPQNIGLMTPTPPIDS